MTSTQVLFPGFSESTATEVTRRDRPTNVEHAFVEHSVGSGKTFSMLMGYLSGRAEWFTFDALLNLPHRHVAASGQRATAETLRPYRGQWVAVKDGRVLYAGARAANVLAPLRETGEAVDAFFFVPMDPEVDRHGEL